MALTSLLFLSGLSARTIIGAYYHGKIQGILDDRSSEESATLKDLTEETVPAYREAIGTLDKAILFDPSRALFRKTLADIYARIGSWAEAMGLLNMPLPDGTPSSREAFELAIANIRETIRFQPTNPDNHLAYGHLTAEMKDIDTARKEYRKAVDTYPGNSPLRYAVVMECLSADLSDDALVHAKELARIDDSYKITEPDKKRTTRDQQSSAYMNHLYGSYLFKSFEVIWRTSSRDMNMLRQSVPDNDEARDVYEIFLESKGVLVKQLSRG